MSQPLNQATNQSRLNGAAQPSNPLASLGISPNTLVAYKHSANHDMLISSAYWKMISEGVIFSVIPDGSLSGLFIALHPPTHAYFEVDAKGQVWFLAWFEPNQLLGRLMALWVAREYRQSKVGMRAVIEVIEKGLIEYGEILAVTANHNVIEGIPRLGYDIVGKVRATSRRAEKWILHIAPSD